MTHSQSSPLSAAKGSGQAHPTPPATIGQRVKLVAPASGVTLRSPFGVIVSTCEWGGYVIVRLDEPAIYRTSHGWAPNVEVDEELLEIVEHPDNMEPA